MTLLDWLIPWEPSPLTLLAFAAVGALYLRGSRRSPLTAPWPRQLAFWLGFAVLYVGLQSQLDYYAEHEFFIHRLQHLGLHHLGPFLIALAYPGVTLRRGLPLRWRTRGLNPLLRTAPVRRTLNVLLNPVVAGVLFVGLIYFWLWPAVHFDAMLDARLYRVMNTSMAVDGLLFWWLILDPRPRPPARLAPGVRVLLALAVMPPQIALGAYISFTQRDLFPLYSLCGRAMGGISPATDQLLGGLVTWIPASMMSVIAALLALRHWMALSQRRRLPQRRRAAISPRR
ncbi:MAG: cytochrome c oxidase assembly protein [Xanthomonadaceae bacterium]|nr:cytochrome c oxidase assembly protein [Xanthomonadaceae bacterium]MDE1959426.1 cytochrome c oxidase assembly protein [Xanthomonadaceae bacterium]MDE2178553.1 cytochrome c oxidase assembly protein [Xanthomonadaceae bacterium]MDE2244732.1 cytochrome c oxidase assembly protein [Xanthomonadaceae bacterium]